MMLEELLRLPSARDAIVGQFVKTNARIAALESELAALKDKAQPEFSGHDQLWSMINVLARRVMWLESVPDPGEDNPSVEPPPKTTGLTFMEAVKAMGKNGYIRREVWVIDRRIRLGCRDYIVSDTKNESGASWNPEFDDIIATDWEIVQ